MQTPAVVLNIGADVAKDEIVVACSLTQVLDELLTSLDGHERQAAIPLSR
jgi:hypothetical protein